MIVPVSIVHAIDDLRRIDSESLAQFFQCVERGDLHAATKFAPCQKLFQIVLDHTDRLKALGVLESLFPQAYTQGSINSDPAEVRRVLSECDRAKLLAAGHRLPGEGPFTVYRGVRTYPFPYDVVLQRRSECGISWSGSLEVAAMYASCLFEKGAYNQAILTATVPRDKVYFYTSPAFEEEFCCGVTEWRDLELSPWEIRKLAANFEEFAGSQVLKSGDPGVGPMWQREPSEREATILDEILRDYRLPQTGYHGIVHWARVLENGMRLGGDPEVVTLFALLHDSRRINEYDDPGHGLRGAEFAESLRGRLIHLDDARFDLLFEACSRHTDGLTTDEPTIAACWDADRLDLGRVGISPDPGLLCSDKARELLPWSHARAVSNYVPVDVLKSWGR